MWLGTAGVSSWCWRASILSLSLSKLAVPNPCAWTLPLAVQKSQCSHLCRVMQYAMQADASAKLLICHQLWCLLACLPHSTRYQYMSALCCCTWLLCIRGKILPLGCLACIGSECLIFICVSWHHSQAMPFHPGGMRCVSGHAWPGIRSHSAHDK